MWKKSNYSVHHIIPVWAWWPNIPENKITIKDKTHVNWHRIFNDAETPQQQLLHVLNFNKQILNDEFVRELLKVLDKYIYNYYKIETHIVSELWSLLEMEKEYFSSKK